MPVGESHIVKSFDDELKKLNDALIRMGALAESQLARALRSLAERDSDLAGQVMHDDAEVDDLDHFVHEQTIRLLALRAPVADDLRMVVSALKVAGDLERIADHGASICKRGLVLNSMAEVKPMRSLLRLGKLVSELLKEVLDAYLALDAERALAVRERDQEVDDHYSSLFREILTYMMEDPRTITACSHLMFIAKNIERVGDHATNVAEMTYFLVTGRSIKEQRTKRDRSALEGGPEA